MKSQGLDPGLALILERAYTQELDHRFLLDCLKGYRRPDMKLNSLQKIGALVRIKKGLYVFGEKVAKRPYCLEVLANKIYSPSYVSLEWALQHHRLIPERVVEITSITTKRSAHFKTPVGRFSYRHLGTQSYSVGIDLVTFSDRQQALVATKEKALCDLLMTRRGRTTSCKMMEETLFEDLRIEREDLATFDLDRLQRIYDARPHSAIHFLVEIVKREKTT